LSLNESTTSQAWTSITIKAFMEIVCSFSSLCRTRTTVSKSCVCSLAAYSVTPLTPRVFMASSTSDVHIIYDPFSTHCPGCCRTHVVLGLSQYTYTDFSSTCLTDAIIIHSTSPIQYSTCFSFGSIFFIKLIFSPSPENIA